MANNKCINLKSANVEKFIEDTKNKKGMMICIKNNFKRVVAVSLLVATIIGASGCVSNKDKNKKDISIPDDFVAMDIDVEVDAGDTVYSIASEYYNDNYKCAYDNITEYQETIKEKNNLNGNYDIKIGDELTLPVIFEKDNKYYKEMTSLKNEISEIKKSDDYWIPYTVTASDSSVSFIAARACGDEKENVELSNEIKRKNGIESTNDFRCGMEIKIINPKLGTLKTALNDAKDNLDESIKNDSQLKEK